MKCMLFPKQKILSHINPLINDVIFKIVAKLNYMCSILTKGSTCRNIAKP